MERERLAVAVLDDELELLLLRLRDLDAQRGDGDAVALGPDELAGAELVRHEPAALEARLEDARRAEEVPGGDVEPDRAHRQVGPREDDGEPGDARLALAARGGERHRRAVRRPGVGGEERLRSAQRRERGRAAVVEHDPQVANGHRREADLVVPEERPAGRRRAPLALERVDRRVRDERRPARPVCAPLDAEGADEARGGGDVEAEAGDLARRAEVELGAALPHLARDRDRPEAGPRAPSAARRWAPGRGDRGPPARRGPRAGGRRDPPSPTRRAARAGGRAAGGRRRPGGPRIPCAAAARASAAASGITWPPGRRGPRREGARSAAGRPRRARG